MFPDEGGVAAGLTKEAISEVKALNLVALLLIILGGLNWLSVGLFEYDVVSELFDGSDTTGARVVYTIVGIAALYSLALLTKVTKDD